VVFGKVPIEVSEQSQDRPFAVESRNAKAVLQIADSFSLLWLILFLAAIVATPLGLTLAVRSVDAFFADHPEGGRAMLRRTF
jgi:hypothetical protein